MDLKNSNISVRERKYPFNHRDKVNFIYEIFVLFKNYNLKTKNG